MRRGFIAGMLAVGVGLAGAAPIYAAAPDLRAEAGLRIRYDDNVFQYSNRNLDRFSPSTLNKFATLESSDDVIVIPSIDVRATWKGRYATRAFAGVDLNQYTKNKDRSSPTYTLGVTQHLGRDTALTLRHRFVPTHLGWRLADPPNQTAAYANAELSSAEWRLAVDHDLNRILSTELYGAWEDRNYNAAFNERDITVKDVGLSGTVKLRRAIALRLGVARETGDAAGAGDAAVNSDTSYRQWSVRLRPTISPTRDWDLGLAYEYRRRDFTAALPADTNYFGREDTTHAVGVDSTVQLRKGVDLRADYDHIRRTSNKSGADLEFGNYTEQRITAGIDYRF